MDGDGQISKADLKAYLQLIIKLPHQLDPAGERAVALVPAHPRRSSSLPGPVPEKRRRSYSRTKDSSLPRVRAERDARLCSHSLRQLAVGA